MLQSYLSNLQQLKVIIVHNPAHSCFKFIFNQDDQFKNATKLFWLLLIHASLAIHVLGKYNSCLEKRRHQFQIFPPLVSHPV